MFLFLSPITALLTRAPITAHNPKPADGRGVPQERTLTICSYLLVVIGLCTALAALYLMGTACTSIPYWDEWGTLISYSQSHGVLSMLHWVWEQNNEHRIVFYKLLLILDMHFLRGRESVMFVAIFTSQLGTILVLSLLFRRIGKLESWAYRSAIGITLFAVFCPSQWENYIWGFQFSFVLVNLLFLIALLCLLAISGASPTTRYKKGWLLACSIFAAAAASVCNANGQLSWFILATVGLMLGFSLTLVFLYILLGIIASAIYFHGYASPPQHASPIASLHAPLQLVEYVEKFFGSTFCPSTHADWSLQVGAIGLTMALIVCWWISSKCWASDRVFASALTAIMIYTFFTACITAVGRINFGTDQAFSPRYQTYALLFWCSVAVLGVTYFRSRTSQLSSVFAVALVILLAASATWYEPIIKHSREVAAQRELAGTALIVGVHDDDLLRANLWPSPSSLWLAAEYLQERGLSLYALPEVQRLHASLSSYYILASENRCMGYVDKVEMIPGAIGGWRIEGWATVRNSRRPLKQIVLASQGNIIGFGVSGFEREDVADALYSKRALRSGWIGFSGPLPAGADVQIYGVIPDHNATLVCKIAVLHDMKQ